MRLLGGELCASLCHQHSARQDAERPRFRRLQRCGVLGSGADLARHPRAREVRPSLSAGLAKSSGLGEVERLPPVCPQADPVHQCRARDTVLPHARANAVAAGQALSYCHRHRGAVPAGDRHVPVHPRSGGSLWRAGEGRGDLPALVSGASVRAQCRRVDIARGERCFCRVLLRRRMGPRHRRAVFHHAELPAGSGPPGRTYQRAWAVDARRASHGRRQPGADHARPDRCDHPRAQPSRRGRGVCLRRGLPNRNLCRHSRHRHQPPLCAAPLCAARPRRSSGAPHHGAISPFCDRAADALLSLRHSRFWPLHPVAVRRAILNGISCALPDRAWRLDQHDLFAGANLYAFHQS